ncbi:MAG TPA: hypothetical protein VJ885_06410 [Thermoanaerobaculia bacterium]|nr:hypothetical protein [Thermoanaerobaculia bacterium]
MIPTKPLFALLALFTVALAGCAAGTVTSAPARSADPGQTPGTTQAPASGARTEDASAMNRIAESYVKLVLAVGQHDADYVDAYYGPPEWRTAAEAQGKRPLDQIRGEASALLAEVRPLTPPASGEDARMHRLRHEYLSRQLGSLIARVDQLGGKRMKFDEESKALYDAVAPRHDDAYFQEGIDQLESLLPGEGSLNQRLDRFRQKYVIPADRVDAVFQAAIAECRRRTAPHVELPAGESFVTEYVTDKPWSGYNWYKGGYHSVIQVNTSNPIFIDRALDLACHEGYPGHHLYNALLEKNLVRDRGWPEFSVYPLYSPQSLIAEGTANFGIEVAFPGPERLKYEKEALYPLAGLDPAAADLYDRVQKLGTRINYASNEAARRLLDGEIDRDQAIDWMQKYGLYSRPWAEQRVRFIERYRSYVINYNLGLDLVRQYIERNGGTPDNPQKRWELFMDLISSPRLPSGLM